MVSSQIPSEVKQIHLGELNLNILQDPNQVFIPAISIGENQPVLTETASGHFSYSISTGKFVVDFSKFKRVQNGSTLQKISDYLLDEKIDAYIILYLTDAPGTLPDDEGIYNLYSTSIVNTYLMVENRKMASTLKMAKVVADTFEFSYIEVIGDVAKDYIEDMAKESLLDAITWIRVEQLQGELLSQHEPCVPGIHWSCAVFHIVDQNGKEIPGATLELHYGSPEVAAMRQFDEWGNLTIPLNSARNEASSGEFQKFHQYKIRAYADGFGTWDGTTCKIFSAPGETNSYTLVLPEIGKTNVCSNLAEITTIEENTAPVLKRIIPIDFRMKITEYIEEWEWQTLMTQCVVETEYHLLEMIDEKTALLEDTSRVVEAKRGDCSAKVANTEQLKVDIFTGARIDTSEPSLRFAGAQSQPIDSSPSFFNNVSVWWKMTHEEIPSENTRTYYYDQEHYIDQFTGIRIYRTVRGWRNNQGIKDDGYCRWQQTLSMETNAPIAGNSNGYRAEYPEMNSGCSELAILLQPPAGDPCIVMYNYYQWMNEENVDKFFGNFMMEGWSSEAVQNYVNWQKKYFEEYDQRYIVNSCNVEWKAATPPFSAILNGKVHSEGTYKGNQSQSDLDVTMYAVYRNGDWFAARGQYSTEDKTAITVPFINSSNDAVEVFWIDYEKNERSWFVLQPGEIRDISTAVTHVWTVYDVASGQRLAFVIIFPNQQPIVISKPQ